MKSLQLQSRSDRGHWNREATGEWLRERISSLLLVPLTPWVILAYALDPPLTHPEFLAWIREPAHVLPLGLFFLVSLYHAGLGLKVIIDDYVHHRFAHWLGLAAMRLFLLGTAGAVFFSILQLTLSN